MRLRPVPQAPCRIDKACRRGEVAVGKPRRQYSDTVRREAPGPWRTGGEDDVGIHVLDAKGERVATIWRTLSRPDSALEAIQALMVRMGDEVLTTRLCASTEFTMEKSAFEISRELGPCLPDFLIKAKRKGKERTWVVEVMGFERSDYLAGKEVTHERMEELGPVILMDGERFEAGLMNEGQQVTRVYSGRIGTSMGMRGGSE